MQQQQLRSHGSSCAAPPVLQQHRLCASSIRSRPLAVRVRAAADLASREAVRSQTAEAKVKRRIILLRHADSETSSTLRDYDRPISIQGKREATSIAKRLLELGWIPDLIIASNSKRTKQTLDIMAEAAATFSTADAHFLGSLYTVAALDGQTKHHLEETIRSIATDAKNFCVMCVGHNKGWEEASSAFARQPVRLGTASAALFEVFGGSWEDVTGPETNWTLVQVVTPI
eukprot:GHUV01004213.1.p1 GENE.GHUV01004213.1~~GHUV01004213.1.p1  ORF type:complete len:230 (+),score=55.38 GHUV01004213.1:387-1076(+)